MYFFSQRNNLLILYGSIFSWLPYQVEYANVQQSIGGKCPTDLTCTILFRLFSPFFLLVIYTCIKRQSEMWSWVIKFLIFQNEKLNFNCKTHITCTNLRFLLLYSMINTIEVIIFMKNWKMAFFLWRNGEKTIER